MWLDQWIEILIQDLRFVFGLWMKSRVIPLSGVPALTLGHRVGDVRAVSAKKSTRVFFPGNSAFRTRTRGFTATIPERRSASSNEQQTSVYGAFRFAATSVNFKAVEFSARPAVLFNWL